jgi:hypothetical protein
MYPSRELLSLRELADRYRCRNQQDLLDIAAVVIDVSTDSLLNLGLEQELNPLLFDAMRRQYRNVLIESLIGSSQERLNGLAKGVKGKYLELIMVDRLNKGESIGELMLGPGQVARLAESSTQRRFDFEIVNTADVSVVEQIQVKATNYASYIRRTQEKYPDIRIATTAEINGTSDRISQTGTSDADLEREADDFLSEQSEDGISDTIDKVSEFGFDALPMFAGLIVIVVEGRQLLAGHSSVEASLRRSAKRLSRASTFSVLGAMLTAIDAGILTTPGTVSVKVIWTRMRNQQALYEQLRSRTEEIRAITSST